MPNGRAAICGYSSAARARARLPRVQHVRATGPGRASTWIMRERDRPVDLGAQRCIHSSSFLGATMSSPATPCGASSKTARPPAAIARPRPNSSSSAAKVPGTGSPSMARWPIVRDVEKPSAPGLDRLLDDSGHRGDVVGGGRLVAGAALAHRVGAHRAVRDLAADVDGERPLLDGVEVLGVALPAPGDALGRARCRECPRRPPSARSATVRGPGRTGANPTPQLPATTVVTPCPLDGSSSCPS